MGIKSTAEIMLNIADAIRSDAEITSLATRYFNRGLWVCVGSYGGDEFTENAAPFCWIYPSDDSMPLVRCSTNDATIDSFAVKIVLGLCPKKDAPSITEFEQLAIDTLAEIENIKVGQRTKILAAAAFGTDEQIEAITYLLNDAESDVLEQQTDIGNAIDDMNAAATAVDISAFDTAAAVVVAKVAAYGGSCDSFKTAALTAANIATAAGHESEADIATATAAEFTAQKTAANDALDDLTARVAAIDAAFAAYVEDPYFREVISERTTGASGVTVFGAVRLLDAFRRRIASICIWGEIGLPVESMTFANKSISHYPLDWIEVTVKFAEPASY